MEDHGDVRYQPHDEDSLDRLRELVAPLTVAQYLLDAAADRPIGGGIHPPPPPGQKEESLRVTRQIEHRVHACKVAIARFEQHLAALGARAS